MEKKEELSIADYKRLPFKFPFATKNSQAINRKANYLLAVHLLKILNTKQVSLRDLFDKDLIKKLRKGFGATRGIHSNDLNYIIDTVDDYLHSKPKIKNKK